MGLFSGLSNSQQRNREALNQQDQARLEAELAAAQFNRQAPGVRMGNSVQGDILAGLQDFRLTGSGRDLGSTGGLRPSLLSTGTRQLGSDVSRQALLSQLGQLPQNRSAVTGGAKTRGGPTATPIPAAVDPYSFMLNPYAPRKTGKWGHFLAALGGAEDTAVALAGGQ